MSHTPGPWNYEYENDTGPADDCFVGWYGMPGVFKADREEDARLIVAAPDLLQALEALLDLATNARSLESGVCCCGDDAAAHSHVMDHAPVDMNTYYHRGTIEMARAAIARATEQPKPSGISNE